MSLSDLDKKILAEGEKIRGLAHKAALEARRADLVAELEKIEADLAPYLEKVAVKKTSAPAKKTAPAKDSSDDS